MTVTESTLDVLFDDGTRARVEAIDPADVGRLREIAAAIADGKRYDIRAHDAADTAGHSLAADSLIVDLDLDDDTQGHAIALRFLNPGDARKAQQRLVATGVLAGVLAIGAVAFATEPWVQPSASTTAPITAPQSVPLPAPRIAPGLRAEPLTEPAPAPKVAPGLRAEPPAEIVAPVPAPAPKVAPGLKAEEPLSAPQVAASVGTNSPVSANDQRH